MTGSGDFVNVSRSVPSGLVWPAVPNAQACQILAVLYQLAESQWWSPERIREQQFRQLSALLGHAAETVPLQREILGDCGLRPGVALNEALWSRVPVIGRQRIQEAEAQPEPADPPGRAQDLAAAGRRGGSRGDRARAAVPDRPDGARPS